MESNDQESNKSVSAMDIHGEKVRYKMITKGRIYKKYGNRIKRKHIKIKGALINE
jgi:hypothetical protein